MKIMFEWNNARKDAWQQIIIDKFVKMSEKHKCGFKVRFGVLRRHRGLVKQNRIEYDSILTRAAAA